MRAAFGAAGIAGPLLRFPLNRSQPCQGMRLHLGTCQKKGGSYVKKFALALALTCALVPASSRAQNAYITNVSSNTVSVIDTVTNTVIATIPVGLNPFALAGRSNATKAY